MIWKQCWLSATYLICCKSLSCLASFRSRQQQKSNWQKITNITSERKRRVRHVLLYCIYEKLYHFSSFPILQSNISFQKHHFFIWPKYYLGNAMHVVIYSLCLHWKTIFNIAMQNFSLMMLLCSVRYLFCALTKTFAMYECIVYTKPK